MTLSSLKLLNCSAHTVRSNLWLPLRMKSRLSCKAITTKDDGVSGSDVCGTFVRAAVKNMRRTLAVWPMTDSNAVQKGT